MEAEWKAMGEAGRAALEEEEAPDGAPAAVGTDGKRKKKVKSVGAIKGTGGVKRPVTPKKASSPSRSSKPSGSAAAPMNKPAKK